MKAQVGDWLLVNSHSTSRSARRGEILAVGADGAPPYTVRWDGDDRKVIMFPGPDAEIVSEARLHELDRIQAQRVGPSAD
jgi:hypothetical protein